MSNVVNQMTFDREKYYDIGIEIFDELARIVDRYRMLRWSARTENPVLVSDEEITTVRIAVFEDGKIKTSGKPEEVFSSSASLFRLELPLAARIKNALAEVGCELDCKLDTEDLIDEIERKFKCR